MRLQSGGLIDRARPLSFVFNDQPLQGFEGDTLASALIANDMLSLGRSRRYHRPRGIVAAGTDETNAVLRVGLEKREVLATEVVLYDGLIARTLPFPVAATAEKPPGVIARLLRERLSHAIAQDEPRERHEPAFSLPVTDSPGEEFDVVVVGGGPAGLCAAVAAGHSGARTLLVERDSELGGALVAERARINQRPALEWVDRMADALDRMPNVFVRLNTRSLHHTVGSTHDSGSIDHGVPGSMRVIERVDTPGGGLHSERERSFGVRAVCLANGATERPLVFDNNDRPGVMLAGALRTYVNRYAAAPSGSVTVFTNNDTAYDTALELHDAGVSVAAVVDIRQSLDEDIRGELNQRGIRVLTGRAVIDVAGRNSVEAAVVASLDSNGEIAGPPRTLDCSCIAVSGGWNPAVELFSGAGGTLRWDDERSMFVPDSNAAGTFCAGNCNGAFALVTTLLEGWQAGVDAAAATGFRVSRPASLSSASATRDPTAHPLWRIPARRQRPKRFVDFRDDLTDADVTESVLGTQGTPLPGCTVAQDVAASTNVNVLAVLAEARGETITTVANAAA